MALILLAWHFTMARYPRRLIIDDGATFHITWRAHNRSFFLEHEWAKKFYYHLLLRNKRKFGLAIYSYCFMSSHPHFTGKCRTQKELSCFMQVVNTGFATAANRFYKRTGQVIQDRFASPQIENDCHLWNVMAYIDLNPVRAKMVRKPTEYSYCSYNYYAHGKPDKLIDPCPAYESLGATPQERQKRYREMVETIMCEDGLAREQKYSTGCFIGDPAWVVRRYEKIKNHLQLMKSRSPKVSAEKRLC